MTQHYFDPRRASDAHALPDLEVFEAQIMRCPVCGAEYPRTDRGGTSYRNTGDETTCCHDVPLERGEWAYWYWHCQPGCLPDSDPWGPFATEAEALADAREGYEPTEDEPEDDDDGLTWKAGNTLTLRAHASEPGKGLSYPAREIIAGEDGCAGGWDVYNVEGSDDSFYGFSVVAVQSSDDDEQDSAE